MYTIFNLQNSYIAVCRVSPSQYQLKQSSSSLEMAPKSSRGKTKGDKKKKEEKGMFSFTRISNLIDQLHMIKKRDEVTIYIN